MKTRITLVVGLFAILAYLLSPRLHGDEAEQEVALQEIPAAVRAAAEKAVAGIKIDEAEVEAVLIFVLEGLADGKEYEIEVTAEGQIVRSGVEEDEYDDQASREAEPDDNGEKGSEANEDQEAEDELEIPLSVVPTAAIAAAQKAVPEFEAQEAEVEPGLIYEVEGSANGVEYEIEVTSEGEVLETVKAADDT